MALTVSATQSRESLLTLLFLFLSTPPLVALAAVDQRAAASALRWCSAGVFLIASAVVWLAPRHPGRGRAVREARGLTVTFGAAPVLLLTAWVAARGFAGLPVPGPLPGSVFAKLGWVASMTVPLGLVVTGLAGHGLRARLPVYLFAAGLVAAAAVGGGYALGVVTAGGVFGTAEVVFAWQLAIVTGALWGAAWLLTGRRDRVWLMAQAALPTIGGATLLAVATSTLFNHLGGSLPLWLGQVGRMVGWVGWLLATTVAFWVGRLKKSGWDTHAAGVGVAGLGVLWASANAAADPTGWRSYHALTFGWAIGAAAMLADAWARRALSFQSRRWVEALCVAVVALAVGGTWGDPGRPYWSAAAVMTVSVILGVLAVWTRRPGYVYASGFLVNLVAYLVWQAWVVNEWGMRVWLAAGPGATDRFLLLQVVAFAVASMTWAFVEGRLRRREPAVDLRGDAIPFPHAAAWFAVQLLAALVLTAVVSDLTRLGVHLPMTLSALAVAATAVALVACFWDPEAGVWGLPAAPLFILGVLAVGLFLHRLALAPRDLAWAIGPSLAGYLLAAGLAVRVAPSRWLGMPPQVEGRAAGWFLPAVIALGATAVALSLWVSVDFPTAARRFGGPLTVALLARAAVTRPTWCLSLAALAIAQAAWATIDPGSAAPWLHRSARALAALAVTTAVYAGGFGLAGRWAEAGRRIAPFIGGVTVAVLAAVFVQEFALYDPVARTTPLALTEVVLVAVLLVGAIGGLLWVALKRRQSGYVWAAEIVAALLLVHLRLNVPDLFPPFLGRHWHFVVMAVGFLGVGLGELFTRRGRPELAGPLGQTGLFLPLLPVIAYLARPLAEGTRLADAVPGLQPILRYLKLLPADFHVHALLWFLLGGLYTLVAVLRRASGYALAAALAANFGLWVIYANQPGLEFAAHPQLWLIPAGLILLAAEALNRDRLTAEQATSCRYAGLLVVYVSSTADLFIAGLGNSVVLPVVLAVLSVAGVLAGILLRVRGYLYLGVAFLALVVFSQIWHAAVNRQQTWVWWACGIALGVAILTLFALFEKRRNDVLRVMNEMRQWR